MGVSNFGIFFTKLCKMWLSGCRSGLGGMASEAFGAIVGLLCDQPALAKACCIITASSLLITADGVQDEDDYFCRHQGEKGGLS